MHIAKAHLLECKTINISSTLLKVDHKYFHVQELKVTTTR